MSPATEGASDGLSRLPLELHFYVLEHFNPDDLAIAINACRAWRYIWLSDEVWPWLAARWFPGLLDQINLTAATSGLDRRTMFWQALVKHRFRHNGRFAYALLHELKFESDKFFRLSKDVLTDEGGLHSYADARDPEPDLERFARFRLYNSGRIAWWPEPYALPYIAVVDDLRTRDRRVYSFPGHLEERVGYQTALGNKLFIMGKESTLHAWHLETNVHYSIELPHHFKRCVTESETVLIVSKDSTVYLWEFGQPFRQVDVSGIYEKAPVTWGDQGDFVPSILGPHRVGLWLRWANIAIDFILHPALDNIFFVVTLSNGTLTVHKVENGELVKSQSLGEDLLSRRALERSGQLRWEKVDSRGGYNLLSIYPMPRGSATTDYDLDELCREISCRCRTWWSVGGHTLVSVCFNIYTESFEVLRHQPSAYYQPRTFHIWNHQLFSAGRPRGPYKWHVASFRRYTGWSDAKALASVPFYATSKPKGAETNRSQRRKMTMEEFELYELDAQVKAFHDVDYFFDASRAPTRQRRERQLETNNLRLVGDDDFLVFFHDETYTAWCFANDTLR
ncbi:f-box domain-containing protein [Seiridium cupressi]